MKKGFKVTDAHRNKKVGIAASDLLELSRKACDKLQVKGVESSCKFYVAADGTQISDDAYLSTLPSQTLLIMVKPGEEIKTELDFRYDLIRSTMSEFLEAGTQAQYFLNTNLKEKASEFLEILKRVEHDMSAISERRDDPAWFEGIQTKEQTKEAIMRKKAKDRVRGYYFKLKKMLQTSEEFVHSKNGVSKHTIDYFIKEIKTLLEMNKYNEHYFDRLTAKSLCSKSGSFNCGGLWRKEKCEYVNKHFINPYRSREERILFQMWNFDHGKEFSRSIIPCILTAVRKLYDPDNICYLCEAKLLKEQYICINLYYVELFTTENMKLVHIICHDKGKHSLYSGVYLLCGNCFIRKQ